MDKLNHCRHVYVLIRFDPARFGAQQDEHWPHAFASGIDNVVTNTFDQRNFGVKLVHNKLIYLVEVSLDKGSDLLIHF